MRLLFFVKDLGKTYIVGELEHHEQLRQLIADIKIELKALEVKIQEKLRSKFVYFEFPNKKNFFSSFIRLHQ